LWRGLLDSEVFGVQTPEHGMARLGLTTTEPADLAFVYSELLRYGPADRVGIDAAVVTGRMPVPATPERDAVLWRSLPWRPAEADLPFARTSIDWTTARSLRIRWERSPERRRAPLGPLVSLLGGLDQLWTDAARDGTHVAVVAGSEGEAELIAQWVVEHAGELAGPDGQPVVSVSWLAEDAAPVGAMPYARLQIAPILSRTWVIVATWFNFAACNTVVQLVELARQAGVTYATLEIDRADDNVSWFAPTSHPQPSDLQRYPLGPEIMRLHVGGLYSNALVDWLLPAQARLP
jgi:hypothetical protein